MAFNNTDFTNSEKILKALDEFLDEQTPPTLERLEDIFPCPIRTLASKQFDGPLRKFVWDVDLTLDKKSASRLTFYTDSCGIEKETLLDRYAHFGPRYNKRCWDTREELNASINIHTPLVWVNIDMDFKTVETMERVIITWTTVTSEVSAKTTCKKERKTSFYKPLRKVIQWGLSHCCGESLNIESPQQHAKGSTAGARDLLCQPSTSSLPKIKPKTALLIRTRMASRRCK